MARAIGTLLITGTLGLACLASPTVATAAEDRIWSGGSSTWLGVEDGFIVDVDGHSSRTYKSIHVDFREAGASRWSGPWGRAEGKTDTKASVFTWAPPGTQFEGRACVGKRRVPDRFLVLWLEPPAPSLTRHGHPPPQTPVPGAGPPPRRVRAVCDASLPGNRAHGEPVRTR